MQGCKTSGTHYVPLNKNREEPIPTASLGSATSPYKVNSTRAHAAPRALQSKRPSHTEVPASYELILTEPVTL